MARPKPRRPPVAMDATPATPAMLEPDSGWLAALVDSPSQAILSKTMDGTITGWNAAAAETLGRSIKMIARLEFRPGGLRCRIELPLADGRTRAPMGAWLSEREAADGG